MNLRDWSYIVGVTFGIVGILGMLGGRRAVRWLGRSIADDFAEHVRQIRLPADEEASADRAMLATKLDAAVTTINGRIDAHMAEEERTIAKIADGIDHLATAVTAVDVRLSRHIAEEGQTLARIAETISAKGPATPRKDRR